MSRNDKNISYPHKLTSAFLLNIYINYLLTYDS